MNPNPPSFFDFVIVSQAIQDIFFVHVLESHQKRVSTDWILLQREVGSLKHCIAWLGIGDSTLLRRVIFPTVERNMLVQPLALCLILSTMDVNRSFFLRPKCSGKPRYFPVPPSFPIPSSVFTPSFPIPSSVFIFSLLLRGSV